MASPNIILSTEANNTLIITNLEASVVYIGLQVFDVNLDTPDFKDFIDASLVNWDVTTIPSIEVGANELDYTINIGLDGLYKLRVKDLVSDELEDVKDIFFIMSSNIDACEKAKLQELLCKTPNDCKVDDCGQIAEDLKFYALKDTVTYFYKKYVDNQGVTVPTMALANSECIDVATALGTLSQICGCVNEVAGGDFYIDASCGCVKYNYTK